MYMGSMPLLFNELFTNKKRFSKGKSHDSRTSMCIPPMIKEKKFQGPSLLLVFFAFKNVFLSYFNRTYYVLQVGRSHIFIEHIKEKQICF